MLRMRPLGWSPSSNKMALATRLRAIQAQDAAIDITKNLLTLQFENSLSDEKKSILILRARSHAILVTHCALATVFVDVFNRAWKEITIIKAQNNLTTHDKAHYERKTDSLSFGIIGCGLLGRQIAHCLLTYGQLHPSNLKISTRRPETLEDLHSKGVECYFNNKRLVSSVHVVILCVLPSQMSCVEEDIRGCISPSHIILGHFSSLSAKRLCQLLQSTNIICPVLAWSNESTQDVHYNHSVQVYIALQNRETVLGTCPIGGKQEGLLVRSDPRLAETIILAVVNLCTQQGLSQEQALFVVHAAVFGESHKKPLSCDRLLPQHFGVIEEAKEKCFPFHNLVDCFEKGTSLLKVLLENESIQAAFASRYCHLFEDYIHKLTYGHI